MWEYKIAALDISHSAINSTIAAVEEALNKLGKDKWEVIAVISVSDIHSMPTAVICKRQK
jgi:hypothetical protein